MENIHPGSHDIFSADIEALDGILEKYPWYTTARIRRSVLSGSPDPLLSLYLLTKPWPAIMLGNHMTTGSGSGSESVPAPESSDEIIDRFLAGGDKKVVPRDDTPTGDVSQESSVFVPDEDLDTEELERIYRDQGLELMNDDVSEITGEVLGSVEE